MSHVISHNSMFAHALSQPEIHFLRVCNWDNPIPSSRLSYVIQYSDRSKQEITVNLKYMLVLTSMLTHPLGELTTHFDVFFKFALLKQLNCNNFTHVSFLKYSLP